MGNMKVIGETRVSNNSARYNGKSDSCPCKIHNASVTKYEYYTLWKERRSWSGVPCLVRGVYKEEKTSLGSNVVKVDWCSKETVNTVLGPEQRVLCGVNGRGELGSYARIS
uniref:Uncharacterized protein n=1 Tax=Nelumbo nucifera TaxID=4432 RepID=A0A822XYD1_NELNU|nr:TPA_asm: hypothetical protein HUJ06_026781 [Nelumbo nucifera]